MRPQTCSGLCLYRVQALASSAVHRQSQQRCCCCIRPLCLVGMHRKGMWLKRFMMLLSGLGDAYISAGPAPTRLHVDLPTSIARCCVG